MYDTIIIGAGPAGFTAGIYAARREMKALIFGREIGGQVAWASEIENYPGFKNIQSFDLIMRMQEQVKDLGVEIKNTEITKIEKTTDGTFNLFAGENKFETKTVIIAMGLIPRKLNIPGESRLMGKGVTYCANCDGPFYKNRTVAVIGGGNAALDAAEVLSKIAKKVYLVHRNDQFKAFDVLVDEVKKIENIEILTFCETKEILGEQKVEGIKVLNSQTNEEQKIDIDGIFIEIGRMANTDLVKDFVDRDAGNHVLVDEKCATKTPGIFAGGDVTQVPYKQISIAIGQGTIAALSAYQYLQLRSGNNIPPSNK